VLESGDKLFRIDAIDNRVTRTYETHAVETGTLVPLDGFDWICECEFNKILRFDPRNGRSKTFSIPTQGSGSETADRLRPLHTRRS
jgi:streptogramin lyase